MGSKLNLNWQIRLKEIIEIHFRNRGLVSKPRSDLLMLIIDYLNSRGRFIESVPRTVLTSKELKDRE